jgi:hypothetical protein
MSVKLLIVVGGAFRMSLPVSRMVWSFLTASISKDQYKLKCISFLVVFQVVISFLVMFLAIYHIHFSQN